MDQLLHSNLWEPLLAGICVSLFNRFIMNNPRIVQCCSENINENIETINSPRNHEDNSSEHSSITSSTYIDSNHHYIHHN